jgi:hypothetical protein
MARIFFELVEARANYFAIDDSFLMRTVRIFPECKASIKFQLFHKVLELWNNTKSSKIKQLRGYIYIKLQSSILLYYKAGKFCLTL